MKRIRFAVLLLALWACPACAEPYLFDHLQPGDRAIESQGKVVVFSRTGIGRVRLRASGAWPECLSVRFYYESGRGMERIEGLTVDTEALQLRGSFRDQETMRFWFKGPGRLSEGGEIKVEFRLLEGALELKLPGYFAEHTSWLEVHWVDAYR